MARKTHKKQHFIPKSYLAGWCDPKTPVKMKPYVWTFPREGGPGVKKAPSNVFTETDMYTVTMPDGRRDLRLEHGLSQLESGINQLRVQYIERRRQIPTPRFIKFIAFIAAMHGRTRRFRDHQRQQWQKIVDVGDDLQRSMKTKTPEERRRIANMSPPTSGGSMSLEEVKKLAKYPIQTLMPAVLSAEVPILSQMTMTVYCTGRTPGFITSDNPVVWFDPEAIDRPPMFRAPGLLDKGIEITLPISPGHLVVIRHDKPLSRGIKPIVYQDAWDATVEAINLRTAIHADETVVACSDSYKGLPNSVSALKAP
ncbi:MAG: DUF4238 domain-containing protein [Pseudomonadota bacterium]